MNIVNMKHFYMIDPIEPLTFLIFVDFRLTALRVKLTLTKFFLF